MRQFLASIGIKRHKVGTIPARADLDEQIKFKNEKLQPRLEEAKAGKRKVFFVDAAHFVLSAFLGYLNDTLDTLQVPQPERKEVVALMQSTKADIVEA